MASFAVHEAVRERISVRSYSSRPVEDKLRLELENYMESVEKGPFGTRPRFKLLDLEPLEKKSCGAWAPMALSGAPASIS